MMEPIANPPLGSKTITLNNTKWPIPKLAVRQWRVVVPSVLRLLREMGPMFVKMLLVSKEDMSNPAKMGDLLKDLTFNEAHIDLLVDITTAGLQRAHKEITREDVLDLECDVVEMMAAMAVIMAQAGIFDTKNEGTTPSGEMKAKNLTSTG